MESALHECEHVAADFAPDPVHDLRVALRRCRSMADGLMALDPHPDWKAMKKAGKKLFQSLGELRDVQIMMDWIEKLEPHIRTAAPTESPALPAAPDAQPSTLTGASSNNEPNSDHDPAAHALLQILKQRESEQKRQAKAALEQFDRKQWRHWARSLPARAAHIRPGSALFKHLALERWISARELHNRALRNGSAVSWHNLRIGIKRFRYIVENFLPAEHALWSRDLKLMQDALGEVHDLDVLWTTAVSCNVFPDETSRRRWHTVIMHARQQRIDAYRKHMIGPQSWWIAWRAGLPQGEQIQLLALRRVKLWAKVLDPDFAHSEHVEKLALELYDGLRRELFTPGDGANSRNDLMFAALLHDVGKVKGNKGHHKQSFELIKTHGAIPGWKIDDVQRAAIIARFHAGSLPARSHILLRDRLPHEQKMILQMIAILRLANAFDATHHQQIHHVTVRPSGGANKRHLRGECIVIAAEGYSARGEIAQVVAAERHLLETLLRRPILVKPASSIRAERNLVTAP